MRLEERPRPARPRQGPALQSGKDSDERQQKIEPWENIRPESLGLSGHSALHQEADRGASRNGERQKVLGLFDSEHMHVPTPVVGLQVLLKRTAAEMVMGGYFEAGDEQYLRMSTVRFRNGGEVFSWPKLKDGRPVLLDP